MAGELIETYHLAPNFTIPPPPKGPIQLGTIVNDLQRLHPINEDCALEIPKITSFHSEGFSATLSKMRQGEYGVWAKALGMKGFGGNISSKNDASHEYVFNFEGVDQTTFNPTTQFISKSMKEQDVTDWLIVKKKPPVYLITGLKIARGPSVEITHGKALGRNSKVGLHLPELVGVAVGPSAVFASESKSVQAFKKSDDFIVGIRAKKLMYKKAWLLSRKEELVEEDWNRGARLLDGSQSDDGEEIVELPQEADSMNCHAETDHTGDVPVEWVIHNA